VLALRRLPAVVPKVQELQEALRPPPRPLPTPAR